MNFNFNTIYNNNKLHPAGRGSVCMCVCGGGGGALYLID